MRSGTIVSAKGIGLVLAVVQSGLTASLHSAEPDRLVLTENGRPKATIILAKEPTRAAQLAAC
ncbi:MAG: hypothetical protein NTW87_02265 [Planctomycetota bacterium]|nr:hypothetical protein [Planctomycetota bacterium]